MRNKCFMNIYWSVKHCLNPKATTDAFTRNYFPVISINPSRPHLTHHELYILPRICQVAPADLPCRSSKQLDLDIDTLSTCSQSRQWDRYQEQSFSILSSGWSLSLGIVSGSWIVFFHSVSPFRRCDFFLSPFIIMCWKTRQALHQLFLPVCMHRLLLLTTRSMYLGHMVGGPDHLAANYRRHFMDGQCVFRGHYRRLLYYERGLNRRLGDCQEVMYSWYGSALMERGEGPVSQRFMLMYGWGVKSVLVIYPVCW